MVYSGNTHLSVVEAYQPRAVYRIQNSGQLLSGNVTTGAFNTRVFSKAILMTNVSQISGTGSTLDVQMQTASEISSPWYPVVNALQKTVASAFYENLSGSLSEFTRFVINVSTSGGIWTQIDTNFLR